jgi:hypothetical protein
MNQEREKDEQDTPVDVNSLPVERRVVVRKIKGRIKKGAYPVDKKLVDDKTVEKVIEDLSGGC